MTKTVLVLGCGPAGLFAAHAAKMAGFAPLIVSRKRKSEMYGAQYLHKPIPELSEKPPFDVEYVMQGDAAVYREKVYGKGWRGIVSPDEYAGEPHKGWDIREAYQNAWDLYHHGIQHIPFETSTQIAAFLEGMRMKGTNHIVSTIPAHMLCIDQSHGFSSQPVWAIGDAPERGIFSPITSDVNTVVCSGSWEDSWYRKSNIMGYNSVEWPENKKVPIEGVSKIVKPLSTNCKCQQDVHRLGRYGSWTKGVLSHDAFYQTFIGLAPDKVEILP